MAVDTLTESPTRRAGMTAPESLPENLEDPAVRTGIVQKYDKFRLQREGYLLVYITKVCHRIDFGLSTVCMFEDAARGGTCRCRRPEAGSRSAGRRLARRPLPDRGAHRDRRVRRGLSRPD